MNKKELKAMFKVGHQELVDIACYNILNLINKNLNELLEDLPAMAYMLWKWDRIQHAGRLLDTVRVDDEELQDEIWNLKDGINGLGMCEDNPKYALEMVLDKAKDEETRDKIYSAWGISVDNDDYGKLTYRKFYSDEGVPPTVKTDINDDISYATMSKKYSDSDLFCTLGSGFMLYKGGVATDECDVPEFFYTGWRGRKDSLPKSVSNKFFKILNRPECKHIIELAEKKFPYRGGPIDIDALYGTIHSFKRVNIVIESEVIDKINEVENDEGFVQVVNILTDILTNNCTVDDSIKIKLYNRLLDSLSKVENYKLIDEYLTRLTNMVSKDLLKCSIPFFIGHKCISESVYNKHINEEELISLCNKYLTKEEADEEIDYIRKSVEKLKDSINNPVVRVPDNTGWVYPVCEYSLICKYKEFNEDYIPALINTAKRILRADNQSDFGREIANEVLEYFNAK